VLATHRQDVANASHAHFAQQQLLQDRDQQLEDKDEQILALQEQLSSKGHQVYELQLELLDVKDERDEAKDQLEHANEQIEEMEEVILGLHQNLAGWQQDFHELHQLQIEQMEQQALPVQVDAPEEVQGGSGIDFEELPPANLEEVQSDADSAAVQ
jgi:chromosome segregation ATPase